MYLYKYFILLRPYQWSKNLLIFLPVLSAHKFEITLLYEISLAFAVFNLIASCIYIINDLNDFNSDKLHPRKRNRPIASGKVKKVEGVLIASLCFCLAVSLSIYVSKNLLFVILIYFIISNSYTYFFKKIMVIDIFILSILHIFRIIAGGVVSEIYISFWLLSFATFIFLSLASVKRQSEILNLKKQNKKILTGRGYGYDDLNIITMISICSGYMSILVLSLYINSDTVLNLYLYPEALWGICLISFYWITRTVFISSKGLIVDDPIIFAFKDKISWICLLITFLLVYFAIGN